MDTSRSFNAVRRTLLEPTASLYRFVVGARNHAFDMGWLPIRGASVPVVSVGNIVTGGVGKTEIVRYLACRLVNHRVGIVSRGYGGSAGAGPLRVNPLDKAAVVGDEPAMLARGLPDAHVVVGSDRRRAIEAIELEVDVVLLDDGFQHRRVARSLDIVVVSSTGPEALLPAGAGREPPTSLSRAGLLWVHDDGLEHASARSDWWTRWYQGPVVRSHYRFRGLEPILPDQSTRPTGARSSRNKEPRIPGNSTPHNGKRADEPLAPKRVHLLAGIARPERVKALLKSCTPLEMVGWTRLPDHCPLPGWRLQQVATQAMKERADAVVTTEKDHIRIEALPSLYDSMPMYHTKVEVALDDGDDLLRHRFLELGLELR